MNGIIHPRAFTTPESDWRQPGTTDLEHRLWAIGEQLSAWGCCHAGSVPPNFGEVMVKLWRISGGLTGEELSRLADELLPQLEAERAGQEVSTP